MFFEALKAIRGIVATMPGSLQADVFVYSGTEFSRIKDKLVDIGYDIEVRLSPDGFPVIKANHPNEVGPRDNGEITVYFMDPKNAELT